MTIKSHSECRIPTGDPVYRSYHDREWGVPCDEDRLFFEKVCLEGFQVGLSWRTILHKRDHFRNAFHNFDLYRLANPGKHDVDRVMETPSLVRNRRKIESVFNNAQRALELIQETGSLSAFFWQFEPEPGKRPDVITHKWLDDNTSTPESIDLANALKKRGWSFVGPKNMYALMQALGIVNDHVTGCHRRSDIEMQRRNFQRSSL